MVPNVRRRLLVLSALAVVGTGLAQAAGRYDLGWHVVASGGGRSAGERFALSGSIGQPAVGRLAGGRFTFGSGFWSGLGAESAATRIPTATGSPGATATGTSTPTTTATAIANQTPTGSPTATRLATPTGTVTTPGPLVVNTTDNADDGSCDASHCSLWEAVSAANRHAGPDSIAFDIPPSDAGYNPGGWWTIRPDRMLSLDDNGTTIDGTTQTANRGDTNPLGPEIELDGSLGDSRGFEILAANNVIRALAMNRFSVAAVRLQGTRAANNRIVGNYLGTDPTGNQDLGNGWGVYVYLGAHDTTIGGAAPEEGNLISGNQQAGIGLVSAGADGNRVVGNRIGTAADGRAALPNTFDGLSIAFGAQKNVVGPGNVVAFNGRHGVAVTGMGSLSNTVTSNRVLRNTGQGIFLVDGGNANLAPPVIVTMSLATIQGAACALCRVEIFSDSEDEGAVYEGSTTADRTGRFTFSKLPRLTGPNVTATVTDAAGNTSAFSVPVTILGGVAYLPLTRMAESLALRVWVPEYTAAVFPEPIGAYPKSGRAESGVWWSELAIVAIR